MKTQQCTCPVSVASLQIHSIKKPLGDNIKKTKEKSNMGAPEPRKTPCGKESTSQLVPCNGQKYLKTQRGAR